MVPEVKYKESEGCAFKYTIPVHYSKLVVSGGNK